MDAIKLQARTEDGVALSVRAFPAETESRAILVCGHAMMANGGYFHKGERGFAQSLAAEGISTYVFDFRAHGQSVPPSARARPTHCFDDYVRQDLPAVLRTVSEHAQTPAEELCYLGHSLGGAVALAAIGTGTITPPRRLSLWAVSLWLEGKGGKRNRRAIMSIYRGITRTLGYAPIRRLRLGTDDESLGYVRQLSDWARRGTWTSREGVDYENSLRDIKVPVWAVLGAGDRLCLPEDAQRFLTQLPMARPLRVVGREHGDAIDPDHFGLFTDERLRPLWRELAAFLE